MKFIFFLVLMPFCVFAQKQNKSAKDVVKQFYQTLYKNRVSIQEFSATYSGASIDNDIHIFLEDSLKKPDINWPLYSKLIKTINPSRKPSYIFKKVKCYFSELTAGLTYKQITALLNDCSVSDEGLQFSEYLELSLTPKLRLLFELNTDTPKQINHIWLSDGISLESKIFHLDKPEKLLLVGSINDLDGYTYIRKRPTKDALIIGKIISGQYFFFVPNSNNDWWQVANKNNKRIFLGYIHKSRILRYSNFSDALKNKVIRDRKEE